MGKTVMNHNDKEEREKTSMDVLLIEPMKAPRPIQIDNGLEPLQQVVGGDIQAVYPFDDPVAIIINDEGKNIGLKPNRALRDEEGTIYDILPGNALIVGLGEENFTDLSPELMKKYSDFFRIPEKFLNINGNIIVLKCPVPVEKHPPKPRRSHDWDAR